MERSEDGSGDGYRAMEDGGNIVGDGTGGGDGGKKVGVF